MLNITFGTIAVLGILVMAVALIVIKMILKKKKGNNQCGCGYSCTSCPMGSSCHPSEEPTEDK